MKNHDRRQPNTKTVEEKEAFSIALQELNTAICQLNKIMTNVKKLSNRITPSTVASNVSAISKTLH